MIMEYNPSVEILFNAIEVDQQLPKDYEVAIFRLVQECLNNSLKHAKPTEIHVKVEFTAKHINVVVRDNGIGFDINEVKPNSLGLIGLRERVELLKGTMKIQSQVGQGTFVMFQIPYPGK